jgi:AcrR family transcriptional regulator
MAKATAAPRQVVGKRRRRKHVQERGNTRRRQLLSAAEEMLRDTQIEELSFKQVCEKAGVPEGSAYHFFANRYDLLTGLANHLAKDFMDVYTKPIPKGQIKSWQDLVRVIVSRAVDTYRSNPATRQIWLSGRAPAQVRLADHMSDTTVSNEIRGIFERFFKLPSLPTQFDVFFHFLELCDVPLSLSVIEHGEILDDMVEESERVGIGYLSTYFPAVLETADN